MLEPMRRPLQRLHRVLFCSLLLGCGFGATSLAGCGARSSTELFELSPAGGAAAWPNTPGGAPTTGIRAMRRSMCRDRSRHSGYETRCLRRAR